MKLSEIVTTIGSGRSSMMAGLLLLAVTAQASAKNEADCEEQGFSCANLLYQGFTYPYDRLPGSFLYINGGVYPYVNVTENLLGNSTVRLPDDEIIEVRDLLKVLGLDSKPEGMLSPIIGYGSNPAPTQLARKFAVKKFDGDVVIPVMKGWLKDFDVAWTPVFVSYGSMPSTITPSPGTIVDLWITWLDEAAIKVMDATEHSNPAERPLYVETSLEGADYQFEGPDPESMNVYVSCFGALTIEGKTFALESVPAKDRKFEVADASGAMEAVVPLLDWKDSILNLVFDNIVSPAKRAERSTALLNYGPFPNLPGAGPLEACKESRTGPEKPY